MRLSTDLRVLGSSELFRLGGSPCLHRRKEERVHATITLPKTPLQETAGAPGKRLGVARGE